MLKLQQANACLNSNDLVQAEHLYRQVIQLQPSCGQAYLGLGTIALHIQQFDKAVSLLTKSCELLPKQALPLIKLAEAFNGVNSEIDGLTALEYATNTFPEDADVCYYLAIQYLMLGKLNKGEQAFKKVLRLSQESVASFALFELTRLNNQPEQYLPLLEKRLKRPDLSCEETVTLFYALGNLFHSQQDYQQAWTHYQQANKLQAQSCQFKTAELTRFFADIKSTATKAVLDKRRKLQPTNHEITPIFIVGLPRTGSTLLEQILIEHQDIASAGEVPYLSREVAAYLYKQTQVHYPFCMQNLSQEQLDLAAKIYLDKMACHGQGKAFVIDKLPANFQSIGLIYKLFPHAKVLNIKRNTADVALSIYRNNFSQNEPYFCSLSEFKEYSTLYADLMAYWQRQLPDFIFTVNYQQLVENKAQSLEAILDFCGAASIKVEQVTSETDRVVKTLSNIQVRVPIHSQAVNNWCNYAEQLSLFTEGQTFE